MLSVVVREAYDGKGDADEGANVADDGAPVGGVVSCLSLRRLVVVLGGLASTLPYSVEVGQQTAHANCCKAPEEAVGPALAVYAFDTDWGDVLIIVEVRYKCSVADAQHEECSQSCRHWDKALSSSGQLFLSLFASIERTGIAWCRTSAIHTRSWSRSFCTCTPWCCWLGATVRGRIECCGRIYAE